MEEKLNREQRKLLEGLLDGDLSRDKESRARRLLEEDALFHHELRVFEALERDLRSLPVPQPPRSFDRRVLMTIMTEPVSNLAGTAVKLYMTLCLLLAAVTFSLTAVLFRGDQVEARAASGISGLVQGVLGLFAWVGDQLVLGVQGLIDVITPVTASLRPIYNALAKALSAASPALLPYAVAFLILTTLAIVWFSHANQKRSTPHATLVP